MNSFIVSTLVIIASISFVFAQNVTQNVIQNVTQNAGQNATQNVAQNVSTLYKSSPLCDEVIGDTLRVDSVIDFETQSMYYFSGDTITVVKAGEVVKVSQLVAYFDPKTYDPIVSPIDITFKDKDTLFVVNVKNGHHWMIDPSLHVISYADISGAKSYLNEKTINVLTYSFSDAFLAVKSGDLIKTQTLDLMNNQTKEEHNLVTNGTHIRLIPATDPMTGLTPIHAFNGFNITTARMIGNTTQFIANVYSCDVSTTEWLAYKVVDYTIGFCHKPNITTTASTHVTTKGSVAGDDTHEGIQSSGPSAAPIVPENTNESGNGEKPKPKAEKSFLQKYLLAIIAVSLVVIILAIGLFVFTYNRRDNTNDKPKPPQKQDIESKGERESVAAVKSSESLSLKSGSQSEPKESQIS